MKRLLITGRHGFVGETVARMVASEPALRDWRVVDIAESFDLRDAAATTDLINASSPHAVLHLAAQSWVPDAFDDPATTLQINLFGTLNLLQALKLAQFRGRMVYVGTGDVYGNVPEDSLPVTEAWLPAPRNPYAVSKLAAEALCKQWAITEAMDVVLARPFNHIGWGQSERFAASHFAREIVVAKQRRQNSPIPVGDIDVTRDFTDVADVVRAYFALFEAGESGETYNVCSGREISLRFVLNRLMELSGLDLQVEIDSRRLRRAEQRRMRGDPAKIRSATGWNATTPLDDSLIALLRYWEHRER